MRIKNPIQLFWNWLVFSFSNGQNSYEVQSWSKGITQEFCRVAHGVPMRKVFTSPRKGREGKDGTISYKYKFFPHLLLSSVKEILHTNIKLEQNVVQSYFQLFRRTGGGRTKKPTFLASIYKLTMTEVRTTCCHLLHCSMHVNNALSF